MFSNFRSIDFPVFTFTAFGNARTRINDNSSRFVSTEDVYYPIIIDERVRLNILIEYIFNTLYIFQGKYMEVSFDFKGDPTGGFISNCK